MSMNWETEWPLIKDKADEYGIDPYFVAAIRSQENGGPGKEFGVLSVPAPTYNDQLRITCDTILNRLIDYAINDDPLCSYLLQGKNHRRLIYNDAFLKYFSSIWAPIGADNDPKGLNAGWYSGVRYFYFSFISTKI